MEENRSGSEEELIRRLRRQEPAAQEELYQTQRSLVWHALSKIVGRNLAEDLVQEVFLRAYQHIEGFRGEASLRRWLLRIATNCALKRRQRLRCEEEKIQSLPAPDPVPDPQERLLDDEARRDAAQALERLGDKDRRILALREIHGLSYDQIRVELDLDSVGTVKSRLHKARESLRAAYHARRPPARPGRGHAQEGM